MKAPLLPFIALAGIGFALSLIAHVASIADIPLPGDSAVFVLHLGIFVVWLPTVLVMRQVARGVDPRDVRKVALSGCPRWMQLAVPVIFAYGMLNFFLFMANVIGGPKQGGHASGMDVRGFSGHWMIFYGVAFATLYSARRKPELLNDRHPKAAP